MQYGRDYRNLRLWRQQVARSLKQEAHSLQRMGSSLATQHRNARKDYKRYCLNNTSKFLFCLSNLFVVLILFRHVVNIHDAPQILSCSISEKTCAENNARQMYSSTQCPYDHRPWTCVAKPQASTQKSVWTQRAWRSHLARNYLLATLL